MDIRLQKYKNFRINGMNMYNAALSAGFSKNTALKHGSELDERADMYAVLDRRGLTDEKISAKLLQLVDCTKVVGYLHNYRKGESGGLEKCEPDEIISNEFVEVPDHPTQLKAIETVLKVKGHLKDKVAQSTIQVNNVIQFFQTIRQSETDVIGRGIDALDVLLGEDKTNGFHDPTTNGS